MTDRLIVIELACENAILILKVAACEVSMEVIAGD